MHSSISALVTRYAYHTGSFTARTFWACLVSIAFCSPTANAQGTWTQLEVTSPDNNAGVMLLLSDGSIMCKSHGGIDAIGSYWNKLTPDINGSYVHGIWNSMPAMASSRLYFSSQILKDGRVYVAGGEYGTGKARCEIYDPVTDTWAPGPHSLQATDSFMDACSEILPDGKVLQGVVTGGSIRNYIYDPVANTYTLGPNSLKSHNESTWIKLPDQSILYINIRDTTSERYIPALNRWLNDDTLHEMLYDVYGSELGASFLLPDGRVFCLGSTSKTAYYTPSGDTTRGTWATGPIIPNGLGAPDAAAAMMANGKILCAFSPVPTDSIEFYPPTYFYEFDYTTNLFTQIHSPAGGDTLSTPCYTTNMLVLPDGSILFAQQGSSKYYVYTPTGTPLAAGKPVVDAVAEIDCYTYMATGTLFNGISEGGCYGDDWQNATNYPIIRLTDPDGSVFYPRTYNWNRTDVMTGSLPDTTTFAIDPTMPEGAYSMQLIVNGNPSDTRVFKTCNAPNAVAEVAAPVAGTINAYPNPTTNDIRFDFDASSACAYEIRLIDVLGRNVLTQSGNSQAGINTHSMSLRGLPKGIYTVILANELEILKTKIVLE